MNTPLRMPPEHEGEHRSITLGDLAALVAGVALVLVLPRSQSYWPYPIDFLGPWPRWLPWCFCLRQALGAACMVLVPVILRRRACYGGMARPAEFLAVCAAMPFLADAIETGLIGTFELYVRGDMTLEWPMAETPTHFMTMAFDPDLDDAVVIALRDMIKLICARTGLSREDAYTLCSLAADLRVTQVVNGSKGIHCMIEKSIVHG